MLPSKKIRKFETGGTVEVDGGGPGKKRRTSGNADRRAKKQCNSSAECNAKSRNTNATGSTGRMPKKEIPKKETPSSPPPKFMTPSQRKKYDSQNGTYRQGTKDVRPLPSKISKGYDVKKGVHPRNKKPVDMMGSGPMLSKEDVEMLDRRASAKKVLESMRMP
jgi:hypothetical protein